MTLPVVLPYLQSDSLSQSPCRQVMGILIPAPAGRLEKTSVWFCVYLGCAICATHSLKSREVRKQICHLNEAISTPWYTHSRHQWDKPLCFTDMICTIWWLERLPAEFLTWGKSNWCIVCWMEWFSPKLSCQDAVRSRTLWLNWFLFFVFPQGLKGDPGTQGLPGLKGDKVSRPASLISCTNLYKL